MTLRFKKIVLFGDSITQYSSDLNGFALAPALQSLYQRKADIVTRGFSGYNTNQAVFVLKEVLRADNASSGDIKLMTIFFGTNDAAFTNQAVPIYQYKANLQTLVDLAKSYNIPVILIGTALHDQQMAKETFGEISGSSQVRRSYADAAQAVALHNKLPFIDLWTAFKDYGNWTTEELYNDSADLSSLLVDGIHFTGTGYKVFYDKLVETIQTHFPELMPDNLEMVFPYYRDIDMENSEKSLKDWLDRTES